MLKIVNHFFPRFFFRIKSRGGIIGKKTRIAYPFNISKSRKSRNKTLKIGNNVKIGERMWISMVERYGNNNYNPNLHISDNCSFGRDLIISCSNNIIIAENLLTSARVFISDSIHGYEDVKIPPLQQPMKSGGSVQIGKNCFIGINACVINCSIGDHVIIGANSVVTKDVPSYSVVAGAPARIIKKYNFKTGQWEKTTS